MFAKLDAAYPLPDDEAMLIDSVRGLCRDQIAPNAMRLDESHEFPWDNVRSINQLGLNAMFIPQEYGGAGLSYRAYLKAVLEISGACAATGITWATNFHAIKPLVKFGNEEQRLRLLPRIAEGGLASLAITENSAGSDATAMRTTFEQDGDDIIVNGSKIFISNGDVADLYLLFGKWKGIDNPKAAISVVIFEKGTPGFSVLGTEKKMGHRASSTAAISFDDCRIPMANLIGNPGEGLDILMQSLNLSRPSVAAHSLGIARAAFNRAVAYVNERKQSGRRIIDNQGVQFMLADMASELALCENWMWYVAGLIDGGDTDIGIESSVLKQRASDAAMKVTENAVQLFGGYGYCQEYEVERLMRDAKINQIWEGTNQIHRQLVGRSFAERGVR